MTDMVYKELSQEGETEAVEMEDMEDVNPEEVRLDLMETSEEDKRKMLFRMERMLKMFTYNQVPWKEVQPLLGIMSKVELEQLNSSGRNYLHFAARYSKVDMVRHLLDVGVDVDCLDEDGMTPLHYVCRYGRTKHSSHSEDEASVARLLIERGADINKGDEFRLTPLHHAALRGNVNLTMILLEEEGINMNCRDLQHSTPLHIAATYDHVEVFKLLREAGADIMVTNDRQQCALHRAAQEGHWNVMQDILTNVEEEERAALVTAKDQDGNCPIILATIAGSNKGVSAFLDEAFRQGKHYGMLDNRNLQQDCAIHYAAKSGDTEVVSLLLDNGANIDSKNFFGQTPLFLASLNVNYTSSKQSGFEQEEDLSLIKLLRERGADLTISDHEGLTPIMIAAVKGHLGVVEYLMEFVDLTTRDELDQSILHLCAKYNRYNVLEVLMEGQEDVIVSLVNTSDQTDNTCLHVAAREGHTDTVRELLKPEYEVDVDNKNWDEQTPIHLAAGEGHVDVLDLLLQHDPNGIFDKDEEDNTPLHLAAKGSHWDTVEKLLAAGASVQRRNREEWTALDCAAAAGGVRCCALLIDNDSELDPVDRIQLTPLHLAAKHGHHKVVRLLLNRGANVGLEDRAGNNALELAITQGHRDVVEELLHCAQWRKVLRTVHTVHNSRMEAVPDTPIRMLIRRFPDLAEKVFDKCIEKKDKELEMDYTFLDDTFSLERVETEDKVVFNYKNNEEQDFNSYDGNGTVSMENHPLMLMVKGQNKLLLRHPLCLALLRRKWKEFGRFIFYFQFFHYILFLISLTGYTLNKLTFDTFSNQTNYVSAECKQDTETNLDIIGFRISVFVSVFFGGLIEISQIIRMKSRYIRLSNLVDWILYGLSVFFVLDQCLTYETTGCKGSKCWQWPVGSFLVTTAWINFLTYFRYIPFFGIFILMFNYIISSVAKFSVILCIFLVAFGLGFHILFIHQMAFDSTSYALLKTYVMMIGEYEFEGIFTEHDDPREDDKETIIEEAKNIPFPLYSTIVFIAFVLVMSIVIMNLMVGLAVDDISEIQSNAEVQKLSLNTILVLESERFLPHLRCCLSSSFLERYINTKEILTMAESSWMPKDVLSKKTIWEGMEKRRLETQGQRDDERERLREQHKEMMTLVRNLTEQVESLQEESKKMREALTKPNLTLRQSSTPYPGE